MVNASLYDIATPSSLAAIRKDAHLRIYETTIDGSIREVQYEGRWLGGTSNNVIAKGKTGSAISAVNIGLNHIRVYYLADDNTIKEAGYDSDRGWFHPDLGDVKFTVAPYSGVAAVFLHDQLVIRVYAQLPDNTIQEFVYDTPGRGWHTGTNLGPALQGTSIAATSWDSSGAHIRVYFQDTDLNVVEKAWDAGWKTGGLHFANPVVRASLAVTSWPRGGGSVSIRLYYGAPGNRVREKGWDGSWYDGNFNQAALETTRIAAVPNPILRVYLQNGTQSTAVTEFAWSGGGWGVGYQALPPA